MLRLWGVLSVVAGYVAIVAYVSAWKDEADLREDQLLEDSDGQTDPNGKEESTTSRQNKTLIGGVAGSADGIAASDEEAIRAACAAVEGACRLLQTEAAKRRLRQRVLEMLQTDEDPEAVRYSQRKKPT
jgi:hypothetical protein